MNKINHILTNYDCTQDKIQPRELESIQQMIKCRTGQLGYHKIVCQDCHSQTIVANSCRNRNCPQCQNRAKYKWIERQKENTLNCKYYHIVSTVPAILYHIMYQNQRKMYNILMKTSAEAIIELCKDKKILGAEVGIIQMLHTWTQQVEYHPHTHMLVTGGGVDESGRWKEKKKDYFIPVKVLSKVYRGKFIEKLKEEYKELKFYGEMKKYEEEKEWKKLINKLYKSEFVTYIKEPYENADTVIEYFGRYAYKVAISESRIIKYENKEVTFKYKDRKDNNKEKVLTVTERDFIRRFKLHILPKGFMKIRGYGILRNRDKRSRIEKIKKIIRNIKGKEKYRKKVKRVSEEMIKCPECGSHNVIFESIRKEVERTIYIDSALHPT